jgi:hypothetical protein
MVLPAILARSGPSSSARQLARHAAPARRVSGVLALPQHADQHRPKVPVLLAVDQELGEYG